MGAISEVEALLGRLALGNVPGIRSTPEGWIALGDILRALGAANPKGATRAVLSRSPALQRASEQRRFRPERRFYTAIPKQALPLLLQLVKACPDLLGAPELPLPGEPARRASPTARKAPSLRLLAGGAGQRSIWLAPYGWSRTSSGLVLLLAEQVVLRIARSWRAFGDSWEEVASHLRDEGFSCRDLPWTAARIQDALDADEATRARLG